MVPLAPPILVGFVSYEHCYHYGVGEFFVTPLYCCMYVRLWRGLFSEVVGDKNNTLVMRLFFSLTVVSKVLAKNHTLNGVQLEVKRHNPALAKPVALPDDPVELEKQILVDAQVMLFILQQRQADLTHLQDKHGIKISWEEGSNDVTLTTVDKTSTDKDRFDNASKEIVSFFDGFLANTTHVTPDAWQAVVENFKHNDSSMDGKVKIQFFNQQHNIALTGNKQDVEGLVEKLQVLNTKIEKNLALEASKTTKIVGDIPRIRLKFLSELDFDKELQVKYGNTQVDIIPDKGHIQIRGPTEATHRAAADVWQALASMKNVSLEMSQNAVGVLRSRACQSFMKEQFTANNLQALVVFGDEDEYELSDTVVIMGMNSNFAQKASHLVKKLVVEESLVLDEGQVQLEKSEKWRRLKDELTDKFILSITFDRNSNRLWLAGRKEDVSSALGDVNRFLKENTIVSEVVELPRGCRRFLVKYREQDLRQIQDELSKHSTLIKGITGDDDEDVIVSGTTDGVAKGTKMIQDLASTVENQRVPVNKPGMRKALNRSQGKKMLALLENEKKCIIEHFNADEDASLKNKEEEEKETKKTKKQCECSFLTPEGKTLMVFKDNICDRNVEVIVNAANAKLKHDSSGVSKAIIDAGGEAIQDECDRFTIEHGSVLEGQVVVTCAGKLPFKKVIHAVGPFWRKKATQEKSMGKTPKEEKLLRYAVTNALDAASVFASVALPAISTGAFEFPHDLCANIMVDAAIGFCEENLACRLSEIQFTSTDDAVVAAFVKEMNARFGHDPNFQAGSKGNVASKVASKRKSKGKNKAAPSPTPAPTFPVIPNVVTTPEGLKLVLVPGDMTGERVS